LGHIRATGGAPPPVTCQEVVVKNPLDGWPSAQGLPEPSLRAWSTRLRAAGGRRWFRGWPWSTASGRALFGTAVSNVQGSLERAAAWHCDRERGGCPAAGASPLRSCARGRHNRESDHQRDARFPGEAGKPASRQSRGRRGSRGRMPRRAAGSPLRPTWPRMSRLLMIQSKLLPAVSDAALDLDGNVERFLHDRLTLPPTRTRASAEAQSVGFSTDQ
jgi:hypothetical protein